MSQNTETSIRTGLDRALKAGIKAAFKQGELLTVAHEELGKATRERGWEHAGSFADWHAAFGLSQGQVSRLMIMYGNEPLRLRFEHSHVNLPADQMSLYQLARIPEDRLKALFDADDKLIAGGQHGQVHQGMSRDEAHQVALANGAPGKDKGDSGTSGSVRAQLEQATAQLDRTTDELLAAERRVADLEAANQALREDSPAWDAETPQDAPETPEGQSSATSSPVPAMAVSVPSEAILTVPTDELVKLLLTREDIGEIFDRVVKELEWSPDDLKGLFAELA